LKNSIAEVLKKAERRLKDAGIQNPRLDAEVMLASVLGIERYRLFIIKNNLLDENATQKFINTVKKRCLGFPLQYLIGHQEFYSLDFFVGPEVLIPRPETELLVEHVIQWAQTRTGRLKICDIGTGSGCIAVTLARYIPNAMIYATDISQDALNLARKNAKLHGVSAKITFLKGDVYQPLFEYDLVDKLDVIVSNPPYIPSGDLKKLQKEIRDFEPLVALDGGKDGLEFYRRIILGSRSFLKPSGLLALEIGFNQGIRVTDTARKLNIFRSIKIKKDYSNKDRIFLAIRNDGN
jgi:release factor glutamine methyltransferase